MKNKIKLFDKQVFWEMINQLKITGIIATAIYFVVGIIISIGMWVDTVSYRDVVSAELTGEFAYILLPLVFVFVPIMVKSVFTYQNRRNASDFYHALPVKRETMYGSSLVAVFAWAVVIMIIAMSLPILMAIILPKYSVDLLGIIKVLGNIFAMIILVIGGFSLGINLTGNNFTNAIVSLMILFIPRIIIASFWGMAEYFMPFITMNSGASLVNNSYNLLFGWAISLFSYNPGKLHYMASFGYTIVLGMIYIVLGALMHKHRKSEMAAQASAYKLVQPVTRMIPAYLFGLFGVFCVLQLIFRFGWDDFEESTEITLYWGVFSMFVLSILAYVIYELITTRRWRKVAQSFKQLPILGGITILSGFLIWLGVTVSMNKEVNANKMEYIEVAGIEVFEWYDEKSEARLVDEELFEIIEDTYSEQMEEYISTGYYWGGNDLVVGINQGGLTFYRRISFSDTDMEYIRELYMHATNANKAKFELPKYDRSYTSVFLTGMYYVSFDEKKLYEMLNDDLQGRPYLEIIEVEKEDVLCYVEIENYGYEYFSAEIPISKNTPKTYEYLTGKLCTVDNGMLDSAIDIVEKFIYTNDIYQDRVSVDSIICVDGDEIVSPGESVGYVVSGSKFERFTELMKRYQDEEGDTIMYIEGWISWYSNEDYDEYEDIEFAIGKKVPRELAEEIIELLGRN